MSDNLKNERNDMIHFINDIGVDKIHISVRSFKCMGASPPFDHPHIYLEIGADNQITCPYCATKFVFNKRLKDELARPAESIFSPSP